MQPDDKAHHIIHISSCSKWHSNVRRTVRQIIETHDWQLTLSPQTVDIIKLETIKNVQMKQNHVFLLSTVYTDTAKRPWSNHMTRCIGWRNLKHTPTLPYKVTV